MGSSVGSQFLSEKPLGMWCLLASASVALGGEGGVLRDDVLGRSDVLGRWGVGVEVACRLGR